MDYLVYNNNYSSPYGFVMFVIICKLSLLARSMQDPLLFLVGAGLVIFLFSCSLLLRIVRYQHSIVALCKGFCLYLHGQLGILRLSLTI